MSTSSKHIDTVLAHSGAAPFNPETGVAPVNLPPMRASTVRFRDIAKLEEAQQRRAAGGRPASYGIYGMDTHIALEAIFKELEGGAHCALQPSGLASIAMVFLGLLSAGDHALVADCVYGPVHEFNNAVLSRMGIEVTFFPSGATSAELEQLVKPNTRLLYVETPGSLLFQMMDIPALAGFAQRHGLVLATDNTWGSGYIYRPLQLGAQVSVVAGTKYIAGHSDVMLGAVVANDHAIFQRIARTQYAIGNSISADDIWLALRGVRTMPVRMAQHARNAMTICEFLAARPEVSRLYNPAWPQDPGHALWRRDCTGANGMLAISLKFSPAQARRFVESLTLFGIGFSWGGFESLVQLVTPAELARHAYWSEGDLALVRLHIGLEDTRDVIADLTQALESAAAVV
ncbi:MAG TPA: cystathionine beta-lyase [Bordetella sp.]